MTTTVELKKIYNKGKKRKILAIFSVFIALIITAIISISLGAASPSLIQAIPVIFSKLFPFLHINPGSKLAQIIIWNIRLPRLILAIIAGAGLAACRMHNAGSFAEPSCLILRFGDFFSRGLWRCVSHSFWSEHFTLWRIPS